MFLQMGLDSPNQIDPVQQFHLCAHAVLLILRGLPATLMKQMPSQRHFNSRSLDQWPLRKSMVALTTNEVASVNGRGFFTRTAFGRYSPHNHVDRHCIQSSKIRL
jgi:hypothetical protein